MLSETYREFETSSANHGTSYPQVLSYKVFWNQERMKRNHSTCIVEAKQNNQHTFE